MNIRRIIKVAESWAITWIVIGGIIGIILGFAESHLGFLGVLIILVTIGAIFGGVGGLSFALPFTWLEPHLSNKLMRVFVATIIGSLSGLLGMYVANKVAGIMNWVVVGSLAGAITGLIFGIIPPRSRT